MLLSLTENWPTVYELAAFLLYRLSPRFDFSKTVWKITAGKRVLLCPPTWGPTITTEII